MTTFRPMCRLTLGTVLDGRGRPNTAALHMDVQPRSCTVSRNGYSEADTWSAEFGIRELPLDPDLIASMSARVYMWDGEAGGWPHRDDPGKEWATEANEMVRGLVDEPEMDTEAGTFTIPGRDYTAVMDPEWDPRVKIPSGKPLDETIAFIADRAAPEGTAARFAIDWQAVDEHGARIEPPICGGLRRSTKKKGLWMKPGKTHWSVIYDLAIAHGFIVYVRDSTIVIASARTQTKTTLAAAPTLVYGRHIVSLNITRKLARNVVPTIVIVAWNPMTRKLVEVKYPEDKHDVVSALKVERDQIERIPAPNGIYDRDSLRRYARMRHEMMARCESTYKIKTRHLSVQREIASGDTRAFIGKPSDLLRLQAGDAIGVVFDPFNGEQMRKMTRAQRVEHVRAMGYGDKLADFVAEHYDRLEQFRQPYYVRTVTYTWSAEDGLEIEIEAVNYASEIREDRFAGVRAFGHDIASALGGA